MKAPSDSPVRTTKGTVAIYAVVGLAFSIPGSSVSQDSSWKPDTTRLEQHILRWPCFEFPFAQLVARWIDRSEWKHLDAHLEAKQTESPRYRVVRGMLAERLGDFDAARAHYAAVAPHDEWAKFHGARLRAFTGEIDQAKAELDAIVLETSEPYLFKLAVTGIAELVALRGDLAAVDHYYEGVWEARKELALRLPLVEPILSVKTELGTGRKWLTSLEPKLPLGSDPLPAETADKALLWIEGDHLSHVDTSGSRMRFGSASPASAPYPTYFLRVGLSRPSVAMKPGWYETLVSRSDPLRWLPQFYESRGFSTPDRIWELVPDLLQRNQGMDRFFESRLEVDASMASYSSRNSLHGTAAHRILLEKARLIREVLRERPSIASTLFYTVIDAASAKETHQVLASEIFKGIDHPVWRYQSLLLRVQAGETPEALRADALSLWRDVRPEEVYNLRRDCPNGLVSFSRLETRDPGTFYTSSAPNAPGAGVIKPRTELVWNLRGESFVKTMRVRYPHILRQEMLPGTSSDGFSSSVKLQRVVAAPEQRSEMRRFADVENGTTLLRRLWIVRDQIGLSEAELGLPGQKGANVVDRAVDVLVRSDLKRAREFAKTEGEIGFLPDFWLKSLNVAVRKSDPEAEDHEADRRRADEAGERIEGIFADRHTGWFITRFLGPEPAEKAPPPDPAELREWLADHGNLATLLHSSFGESDEATKRLRERWDRVWSQMVPGIEDRQKHSLAVIKARQELALSTLPHPLWGLEWLPSNARTMAILSSSYDLPPRDPAFLVDQFPDLIKNPGHHGPYDVERDPDHVVFRASVKLVTAYGDEVLHPSPLREAEMRPYSERYPFVADLLAVWTALLKDPPTVRPFYGGLAARELDGALRTLESTGTTRAKTVLATIHHHYGDRAKSRKLAEDLAKGEGPESTYLEYLNSGVVAMPAGVPVAPSMPKRPETTRDSLIERAKSILGKTQDTSYRLSLFRNLPSSDEERRWLYEWLKSEIKEEPAFSRHAILMADFARALNLPASEIAAAEEMDRRLNQEGADYWMRRRDDLASQEADALIEAVKRVEFLSEPGRSLWYNLDTKLQHVIDAGRTGELASAVEAAMRRNPPGSGEHLAAEFFEQTLAGLVEDRVAKDRDARIRRLLSTVHQHQRQLFLWNYDTLFELSQRFENGSEEELATALSRFLLRGAWARKTKDGVDQPQLPSTGQRHDLSAWSEGPDDEIEGKAAILPLFDLALRGEDVEEFVEDLTADARANPNDEYLLTCALTALSKRGPLPADALALLEKSEAQGAMRVAWRLCEHAPSENVRIAELVPALERGLVSIFQDERRYLGSGSRHYLLAEKLSPWMERGGGLEPIRRLLPRFVEHSGDLYFPASWKFVAETAARCNDAEALAKLAEGWEAHCEEAFAERFYTDWTIETIDALTDVAAMAGAGGSAYATLSHRVWSRFYERFGATTDLPAASAYRVGTALLAAGDRERLATFISLIEVHASTGSDAALAVTALDLRKGLALLAENEPVLPSPEVWIDAPELEGEPSLLRWVLSAGPTREPISANGFDRSLSLGVGRRNLPLTDPLRQSPPLTALGGRYDLEVFTGPSPSQFVPAAKIPLAAATGSMELRNLPPGGWIRGVIRVPNSERARFGEAKPFANGTPIIDTAKPRGKIVEDELNGIRNLIGGRTNIAEGAGLILKIVPPSPGAGDEPTSLASALDQVSILGFDEKAQTVWQAGLSELLATSPESFPCSDGGWILRLDSSRFIDPRRRRGFASAEDDGRDTTPPIRSVAIVGDGRDHAPLPRVLLWVLPPDPIQPPRVAAAPFLDHKVVASFDFNYDAWHFSGKVPRAAFSGEGNLIVFDTSATPWKPVFKLADQRIKANERVFVLDADSVCLSQWRADTEEGCAAYFLRWKDAVPVSLDDAVKTELPFDPVSGPEDQTIDVATTEYIPDGDGLLLLAGGSARPLRLIWINTAGKVLSGQMERPQARSNGAKLVWWGKNGNFAVWEKGFLHHFQATPEGLAPGEIEVMPVAPLELPDGAMRGRSLESPRWILKRSNFLLRCNRDNGTPLEGYHLKVSCLGVPISLGGESKEVFLKTDRLELISVNPAPTEN